VTVLKSGPAPWQVLGKEIGAAIRARILWPEARSSHRHRARPTARCPSRKRQRRSVSFSIARSIRHFPLTAGKVELIELRG